MEMHPIQKHIFKCLATETSLPYIKLKPARVEGNQFTYHLKKLMQRGYLKKVGNRYALTTQGVRYTTSVNMEFFNERIQPKIATLSVCKNSKTGKYLLYTRGKQPFLGMYGFPYGKIHLGERIEEAALRELKEKTGIETKLRQRGIAYMLVRDAEGEIITHMLFHVFAGVTKDDTFNGDGILGKLEWVREADIARLHCMPGVADVLRIAKHSGPSLFFEEFEFDAA